MANKPLRPDRVDLVNDLDLDSSRIQMDALQGLHSDVILVCQELPTVLLHR